MDRLLIATGIVLGVVGIVANFRLRSSQPDVPAVKAFWTINILITVAVIILSLGYLLLQ